jgi:group I intron endonuclease
MIESKETGVYKITNLVNGKFYIGSSTSEKDGFKDRINTHIRLLNRKTHYNKHLQSAWLKYGSHNFKFEIVEVVYGKDKILEREQYYITLYGVTNPKIGYNKSPKANSQLGFKHTEETKKKMSESAKIYSKEISERMKKLHTGKKMLNETKEKISKKLKACKRNEDFKNKMSIIGKNRIISEEIKNKISQTKKGVNSKKRKPVYQVDLNDEIIKIWSYAGEAEEILNISKGKISAVCLGKRKTAGGFKWKYYDEMDETKDN